MQSQVKYEYNNTALPRNVSNSSVLRTTAFWDAMQIKVLQAGTIVRQNLCNKAKKRKKSRFFWILKKNVKNVNVMTCKDLETTQSVFVL